MALFLPNNLLFFRVGPLVALAFSGTCGTVQRGVAQFLHVHPTTICYGHPAMSADLGCGRARMLVAVPALWSTMYPLLAEYRHCGL